MFIRNLHILPKRTVTTSKPVVLSSTKYGDSQKDRALPPLIICHGLFGQKTNWNSVAKALQRKLGSIVYTLDMRNHGASPRAESMTYADHAADIMEFIKTKRKEDRFDKVNLLGHSMGGKAAMRLAVEPAGGALLNKLIVEDVSPKGYSPSSVKFRDYIAAMRKIDMRRTRQEILKDLETAIPELSVRQFLLTNLQPKDDGSFDWKCNIDAIDDHVDDILARSHFMTSIVKLEALSGVKDDGPLCYLLQLDDSYILLDCGWDDTFDLSYIAAVKDRVQNINAVLITYPDIPHLGALPYLVAKCGLNCPVYATVPVFKMGQMFMYDWVNGHTAVEDFDLFSLDDVDTAFERVQQVKYNQTILLKGDNGIQFTPIAAGHMIGGAIWKISKQGDEEIIYAVDYNHKKERHLNGALFDNIVRPHLFITDAYNAAYSQSKRRDRDEELVTKMLTTVRGGGDCLVVIDTAGRILEIAHLLDGLWANSDAGLSNYNLVMLSHVASTVVDFAKSQVEWMSEKILKSFENGRYNPFSFRNVQLCHSLAELARVRSPKVVLCSGTDMESGFSRELFLEWSSDTRNCIILTCRAGTRTLASKLIAMTDPSRNANRQVQIEVKRRIRLEGMELEQYKKKKMEKEQEAARLRLEQTRRNARVGVSRDDDEDDDSEDDEALANAVAAVTGMKPVPGSSGPGPITAATRGQSSNVSAAPSNSVTQLPAIQAMNQLALEHPYDLMLKFELQQKSAFFKQTKKTYPMFPYVEDKVRWDDYGEIIRPEEYITNDSIIIETNMDNNDDDDGIKKEVGVEEKPTKELPKVEEWPTKCISYHQKLEVLCKLEFIDFEGRSDGESIKKILAQIKPKQLIIVHGSKEATRHLAQYAHDSGIVQGRIFSPNLGQIVDATVESHIYQVTLSDAVMTQMMFQPVRDAELSWVDARILRRNKVEEEQKNNVEDEIMEVNDNDEENSAGVAESQRQLQRKRPNVFHLEALAHSSIPSHQAVFVNDPKLSDLKQILVNAGYQAEFSSGVLYINGIASIKRNEAGRFHVEGCAGLEYYKIRDVIYNQFAII